MSRFILYVHYINAGWVLVLNLGLSQDMFILALFLPSMLSSLGMRKCDVLIKRVYKLVGDRVVTMDSSVSTDCNRLTNPCFNLS